MMARMDNGSISSCFDYIVPIIYYMMTTWPALMISCSWRDAVCTSQTKIVNAIAHRVPIDCCLYCCILYCCTLLLHQFKQSETSFSHQYIVNPIGIGNYCGSCSWCSCCWIWCTQQYAAPSSTAVHCIERTVYIPYYTVLASNHNIEWLSSRYNWNKPRPDVISCAGYACCDASAAARWREQVIVQLIF